MNPSSSQHSLPTGESENPKNSDFNRSTKKNAVRNGKETKLASLFERHPLEDIEVEEGDVIVLVKTRFGLLNYLSQSKTA
ncbi:unnamed protein product [Dovyalis caffra]|uniref:Uncharacterized protein n=1 Tax=Dovyalis caffra TaxID=77055 RepID=A0AAV1S297_9ROSI|nr:unnamed protein product [Dovyalis caffra]